MKLVCSGLVVLAAGTGVVSAAADEARRAFFEQRIRPVLVEHCYECHSAGSKKLKGGLHLDSKAGVLRGGDSKAAIVPGAANKSLLIEAIRYGNRDLQMPPKVRLPDAVVADLTQWINDGAFDPRDEPVGTAADLPRRVGKEHWAFQLLGSGGPPKKIHDGSPGENPIDRFIEAKLAERALTPAPEADRRTLIRRATYDLTGLPPTPEEIAQFVNDRSEDAFARLLSRLLDSPRYGERWARWWLDVARYADSNGQDENKFMANAWRYRDWVVRSFNTNQPFDGFITEQLAGDLLPATGVPERTVFDRWTATGFLVMGPKMLAEQDKPKLVMDLVDEQIDVVTRAFLGLTVGCARCHDHKFDPIPARDYYALAGIFRSTKTMANLEFVSKFNERRITTAPELAAIEAHAKQVTAKTNELQQARQRANQEMLTQWRNNLGRHLADAIAEKPVTNGTLSTNQTARLRGLLSADPATNGISRTLRKLAADPAATAAFLERAAEFKPAPHLLLAPGKIGAAFQATGGNHLEMSHSPELEPAQLTVEAWVRAGEFPKGTDPRRWLVAKSPNEWAEGHYALMLDGDRPGAYLNIGGSKNDVFAVWSTKQKFKPNQWHHLAMTYDGIALRLFVDGKSAGETMVNKPRVPGTGPLTLGRRPDGYVNFKGLLDEVHVYRRALAADEVKKLATGPQQSPEVVARWEFNDLSPADQDTIAAAEAHAALFAAGGIFELPKDAPPHYSATSRAEITSLEAALHSLQTNRPAPVAFALAVEEAKPVDLPVHIRGSHLNPAKDPVPRGFIQAANRTESKPLPADRSGRLELARWLTNPEHPLTARVIVNRIWQAHFGEGLVRTPDNFGVRGETPSHPELLDWLAREFIRTGWDVKALHRLILTSAAWRQAGTIENAKFAKGNSKDPDNRLLWHFPRQRLEAEMIRDALLAVSGRLDTTSGGSLVPWKNDEYTPTDTNSATSLRRSIYLPVVRDRVFDVFTIFDFANPSVGTSKRTPTVVSHQALFFLNSPLVKESAQAFARNLLAAAPADHTARIRLAYERALGRAPTEAEIRRAAKFITSITQKETSGGEESAWAAWSQMLLAANEFIYRE